MRSPLSIFALLICAGCGESPERTPGETAPTSCAPGYLPDAGTCVPEACGAGTWGNLAVDASTVFVRAEAPEGGDGSEASPLRSIQPALDLAGSKGGGLVAVAAGTYAEALTLSSDHAGVHLAGRCRELVVVGAGEQHEKGEAVSISTAAAEVQLSGLNISGPSRIGVYIGSGTVGFEDVTIQGSLSLGMWVDRYSLVAPTYVELSRTEFVGNSQLGLLVSGLAAEVVLRDSAVRGTLEGEPGQWGYGVMVDDGGRLTAVGSEVSENVQVGIAVLDSDTEVSLERCTLRDTMPSSEGEFGYGLMVLDGAKVDLNGCEIVGNTRIGVVGNNPGTRISIRGSTVRDTLPGPDGEGGLGISVHDACSLSLDDCELSGNRSSAVLAYDAGTEVVLRDSAIRDTLHAEDGLGGYALQVTSGGSLLAEGCDFHGNTRLGMLIGDTGTQAVLRDCWVRDTLPTDEALIDGDELGGYGIQVDEGASLLVEGGEISGNTELGVLALAAGTEVVLRDCCVRDTLPEATGRKGVGIEAQQGATVRAEGVLLRRNQAVGAMAADPGSEISLWGCTVRDTLPDVMGNTGYGVSVLDGATVVAQACDLVSNTSVGFAVDGAGSLAALSDCSITGTTAGHGKKGAVGIGAVVQGEARLVARDLVVRDSDGPGLRSGLQGSQLICDDCALIDNRFAGAVVKLHGELVLRSTLVTGTRESVNLGGGVGVYAEAPPMFLPPSLTIVDSVITDNLISGVHLVGEGTYILRGNEISGSAALPHGGTTRCGDGVYAAGVQVWDGSAGLLLENNTVTGNEGTGLFLDNAQAVLAENSWWDNAPDLLVQGEACHAAGDDYDEAPERVICPEWDQPVCELDFSLEVSVGDIDEARGVLPPIGTEPSLVVDRPPELSRPLARTRLGSGG